MSVFCLLLRGRAAGPRPSLHDSVPLAATPPVRGSRKLSSRPTGARRAVPARLRARA